jgi:periplasmic protein TonB
VPKPESIEDPDQELKTLLDSMRNTLTAAGFSPDTDAGKEPSQEPTVAPVSSMPEPVRTLPQSLTASTAPALHPVPLKQPSNEKLTVMPAKSAAAAAAAAPAKVRPAKSASRKPLIAALALLLVSASGAGGWYAWKMRTPRLVAPQPRIPAVVTSPVATDAAPPATVPVEQHSQAAVTTTTASGTPAVTTQPAVQQPAKPKVAQPEAREIAAGKAKIVVADAGSAPTMSLALNATAPSNLGNAMPSAPANVALKPQGITQGPSARVNPRPAYPIEARKRGTSGTVVLKVQVNAFGEPTKVQIVSGHPSLAVPAQNLVKSSWQFYPATVEGKPVAGETEVRLNFHP